MEIITNTNPQCKIIIEKGIINNKLPEGFVITDTNLYFNYKDLVLANKHIIIKAGEQSKNLETYFEILKSIPENTETIIAFGGGVVGDIAGFVASTYRRGIKLIIIPTTFLAMVDSSIGGKNGVNLGEKKNYVGTIYQPAEVLIDVKFLKTLPQKEFKNGLGEVIKYSYIFGKPELDKIKNKELIEEIIIECCKNKVRIVEKDVFDKNYRHVLNFGHTIGHAIELLTGLEHGEAIAIGMVKELEIADKLRLINNSDIGMIKKTLESVGLPVEIPKNLNINKVIEIMKSDKKGKFRFAFSEENYDVEVEEDIVRECLN